MAGAGTLVEAVDGNESAARPGAQRVRSGSELYWRIHDFLIDEARLLDDGRFNDWFELLAEDISYTMPVRQTTLRRKGTGIEPRTPWFYEDIESMRVRVRRVMESDKAYSEDPPSRTRHFVSNIVIHETDRAHEYAVSSYLLLLRNRGEADNYELASADRQDILRVSNEAITLVRRTILIDQARLGMQNLAVFM